MEEVMLTTTDNPFDPFTQWDDWYAYDEQMGYCSCGYLARIVPDLSDFPEDLANKYTVAAIDEIVRLHPFGPYTKATRTLAKTQD